MNIDAARWQAVRSTHESLNVQVGGGRVKRVTTFPAAAVAVVLVCVTAIGFGALLFPHKASAGERFLGGALLTVRRHHTV